MNERCNFCLQHNVAVLKDENLVNFGLENEMKYIKINRKTLDFMRLSPFVFIIP